MTARKTMTLVRRFIACGVEMLVEVVSFCLVIVAMTPMLPLDAPITRLLFPPTLSLQ